MTEITFVDKMITILASVERFLWIVDKLACDPFPARHKYRKLHRVLSGHRAAFNKTAEWNLHLFLPPCHHGEALWRLLFTKRLEMALFNQVEPSVCVWGHACAFITERVCDVSDLRLTHKLCWFPLRCTNLDESRLWTYEDWAQRLWVELWPVKVDEVWGLFQSKVWNVCGLTQTFVSFVVLLCDRRLSAAGFTLMMFVAPLPRSSCV